MFNFENEATDYKSGEILNLEGNITQNLGRWAVGVTGYAMIQTTDSIQASDTALPGDVETRRSVLSSRQIVEHVECLLYLHALVAQASTQ